jgi:hypothetical protein
MAVLRHMHRYVGRIIRRSVLRGLTTLAVVGAGFTVSGAVVVHEITGAWPVLNPFGLILGAGALAGAVASYVVTAWTLQRAFAPILKAIELGLSVKDWAEGLVMRGSRAKEGKLET